jgi:hypothetical protein
MTLQEALGKCDPALTGVKPGIEFFKQSPMQV